MQRRLVEAAKAESQPACILEWWEEGTFSQATHPRCPTSNCQVLHKPSLNVNDTLRSHTKAHQEVKDCRAAWGWLAQGDTGR
mmetsp:Transcript_4879/g.7748  ORF Transcript_4879/g.7748 Transcript_4879/m.7748 type:complete len:82 (-) Transcript_4879:24-269(-)